MNTNLVEYIDILTKLNTTLQKIDAFIAKSSNDKFFENDIVQQINNFFMSCELDIKNDLNYQLIVALCAENKSANNKYIEYLFILTCMGQYQDNLYNLNKSFCYQIKNRDMLIHLINFSKDANLAQTFRFKDDQFLTHLRTFINNYIYKIKILNEIVEKCLLLEKNSLFNDFYLKLLIIKANLQKNNLTIFPLDRSAIENINSDLKAYGFSYPLLTIFPEEFWKGKHIVASDFIVFIKNSLYGYIFVEYTKLTWILDNQKKSLKENVIKEYTNNN